MSYTSDAEGQLLREVYLAKGGSQPVLDSINHFYRYRIPQLLSAFNLVTNDGYIATFTNSRICRPTIQDLKSGGRHRDLWPYEARRNNLSYMAQLFATLQLNQNVNGRLVPIPGQTVDVFLGKIPAILHSEVCRLYGLTPEEKYAKGEPEMDPGAYAIIKGMEKVLLNIENLRTSEAFLYEDKEKFTVRYTSQSLIDTTVNIVKEEQDIHVTFSKMGISNNSVNVFFIFYVLGFTNKTVETVLQMMDDFIIDKDPERQARRRQEMRNYMQLTANTFIQNTGGNQEIIYNILAGKIHDKNILGSANRNNLIMDLIWRELFKNIPLNYRDVSEITDAHVSGFLPILVTKARMLSSMIVKYVEFRNGYRDPDDRDRWGSKQLVDTGRHLGKAFARIWRLMINNIQSKITTNKLTTAEQIKRNISRNFMAEQFINAYNKELFISNKGQREIAIVDSLKRDNILSAISHIRRISTPTNRRAKIREKRLIHNTSWGVVCPTMSPEGESCFFELTMVTLSNGEKIQIKDLKDGDEVLTIDPITLQQSPSTITNHFVKSSEEYGKSVLKITTMNRREAICTSDHPFLTQYGWCYAKDLNPETHLLAIYPGVQPLPHTVDHIECILDDAIFDLNLQCFNLKFSLINKHTRDLHEKNLLPLYNNDPRLPIISRICGFLFANGTLSRSEDTFKSDYCFDTQYDGELFLQDMAKLGFHKNKLSYSESTHHCWTTTYGGCFATFLLALGMMYGKSTEKKANPVPDWVLHGSPVVKREFVAGFQGGGGSKILWEKRHDKVKAGKFNFDSTIQYKSSEHIESLYIFMEQLAGMCTELGIEVLGLAGELENPDMGLVRINFSDKEENILKYMDIIGYRYATTKSTKSYHISEYLRFKHSKIQERIDIKEKIHKLKAAGIISSQIAKQFNLHITEVTSILEFKGNGGTLAAKDILAFEEWLEKTKAKNNCIFMPIDKIEDSPPCMVADFTTKSANHSMISDGFVTHNCGLTKDAAITTYVSLDRDESVVRSRLEGRQLLVGATIVVTNQGQVIQTSDGIQYAMPPEEVIQTSEGIVVQSGAMYSVNSTPSRRNSLWLNGVHLGFCDSENLRKQLVHLRVTGQLYFDTGIILDQYGELKIFTNEGRICRPLLIVDETTQDLVIDIKGLRGQSLETLMMEGVIEYIDVAEQEQVHMLIAEDYRHIRIRREELITTSEQYERLYNDPTSNPKQVEDALNALKTHQNRMKYTHCEIDPTAILGISAISMPFPEFNPGPRDTYQASMVRQALGGNSSRNELRFDTTMKTILEPGVPTVSTDAHEYLGLDEYPSGHELVIAITTYGGSNQEDALTFNKAAIDLGLFLMMIYHSYKTTVCQSTKHKEVIRKPDHSKSQDELYAKLDPETNIVRVGEYVKSGDCLVGKVIIGTDGQVKDDSLYVDIGKEGIVDEVYITENAEECKLIRIRLRELRKLQTGDKLASRYSQKGTIGEIVPEKDMPWIVSDNKHLNGVKPHIIFNPHGIPSRMTMGKLLEILVGKITSVIGERFNATAFRRFGQPNKPGEPHHENIFEIKDQLELMGFSRSGKEKMVSGITGREMDVEIYTGTVYYQLLRHLVKDKMQARGTGTLQFLTRQPTSGIRKEGGLRLG